MEHLIADYLFKHRNCPLPGIGCLHINQQPASFILGEQQVTPPIPVISFSSQEKSSKSFIQFIAYNKGLQLPEAEKQLTDYCHSLDSLDAYSEKLIPAIGKFYVNAEGGLIFKPVNLPEELLPPVQALKVIHPDATHAIMVGDKESNSAIMTEYYSEAAPVKKRRWWIAAVILALIAIITIVVYFFNDRNGMFGNAQKTAPAAEPKTYSIPKP